MSGVVDVGEALELTFAGAPGSQVSVTWIDPNQATVVNAESVPEVPANSGLFPRLLIPTAPGMWAAMFLGPGQPETYYVRARPLLGPPPFAAIGDVAVPFGVLTAAQEALAGHLLRAASALLRQRVPSIDADVAAGRVDQEVVALTVAQMVLRVMRNPQGLRGETTGPFSRTYDTTAAAGLLVVTDYDLAAVTPVQELPAGVASVGVGTIRVQPGMAPPTHPLGGHVRRPDRAGRPAGWMGYPYG
ncbi:hypothetical protein AB0F93_00105 [Micromonospora tulbaghiae]|uniref:hypothetical protein n=1 Tax=Micromonospora tulbaghiae TaxID=479978 RepID=UPI0033315A79